MVQGVWAVGKKGEAFVERFSHRFGVIARAPQKTHNRHEPVIADETVSQCDGETRGLGGAYLGWDMPGSPIEVPSFVDCCTI